MKGATAKTSTDYQREYRERMRQLGLVKKDVWIRPEYAAELATVEKRMRMARGNASLRIDEAALSTGWTVQSLYRALAESGPVRGGAIVLEWMEGAEPSLHLTMREYGDLPVFVAVGGEQVIVEALMWPLDHVTDPAAFNAHVLRTHKILPLTTVGIEVVAGTPCYIMFGALDTHSSVANVLFEIETLADNVIGATQAFRPYLRADALPDGEAA